MGFTSENEEGAFLFESRQLFFFWGEDGAGEEGVEDGAFGF